MKRIIVLSVLIILCFVLSACETDREVYDENAKPIVVLPDKETAETVNGYKPKTDASDTSSADKDATDNTSDEQANPDSTSLTFDEAVIVGNRNSLKYHVKECRYATKILEENLALFTSTDEASKQGYKPCGVFFKK